ncbi:MAG TPA: glycoside hydrolase family 3 N-terminal domain-containing protein [Jatrophihabitans sp.]|jgi:beta-N-acetylhexosaminidase|nr:glycoside hydrolase family 3 N-terminal domain-containing protein [Jatrophihabitans sp.]
MMRRFVLAVAGLALTACTASAGPASTPTTPSAPATAPSRSSSPPATTAAAPTSSPPTANAPPSTVHSSPPPPRSTAQRALAAMSERERIGQLLMVDCSTTGVSPATSQAITRYHVGSVILDGTSQAGLQATQSVTSTLQGLAPRRPGLFIATDQEGGLVQRLQGPGFTQIVSAVQQGRIAPATLQGYAQGWGMQLRRAGVNVNLAPVLDIVPAGFGSNPPIGDLDREYGHTPAAVTAHGLAVARGMNSAGIDVTVKHFPGLGRVSGNTDTTAGVRDTVTTRNDPYLAPFRAAVRANVPFVMMSTAIYTRIDPAHPAAFSRTIVTGMLRGDLGFQGLIISDDIGAAAQVSNLTPGERAVAFVAAGGDIVLTVDANQTAEMTAALLARTRASAGFKKLVDTAALRVLERKQAIGLLS